MPSSKIKTPSPGPRSAAVEQLRLPDREIVSVLDHTIHLVSQQAPSERVGRFGNCGCYYNQHTRAKSQPQCRMQPAGVSITNLSNKYKPFFCSLSLTEQFFGPHMGVLYGKYDLLDKLTAYKVRPALIDPPDNCEPGTGNIGRIYGVLSRFVA